MSLESSAVHWLRFKRRALVILLERWPLCSFARPDVFAVTKRRETIEIEIKRSMGDFRANGRKHHVAFREAMLHQLPHFAFFLVPHDMADRVAAELPPWAGLMIAERDGYDLEVLVRAPRNDKARRLSLLQVCRLGLLMGAQLYGHIPPGPRHPVEADYEI